MWVYHNGKFVQDREASVGVFDGGLLHGAGLFETMRAENSRVFRLEAHVERLRRSSEILLRPIDRDQLPEEDDCWELLARNSLKTARLRLTVTAGSMWVDSGDDQPEPTVLLTAIELTPYPPEYYDDGISVTISRFKQSAADPLAGHKTTSRLSRLLALREAQQARCVEALWFTTENLLAEGSISNIFIVRDGIVATPPLSTSILPGIARAAILDVAQASELKVEQRAININDLLDADEVFLTNTIMQVMPVTTVEKRSIGDGKVGPVAAGLLKDYRDLVRKECVPK